MLLGIIKEIIFETMININSKTSNVMCILSKSYIISLHLN